MSGHAESAPTRCPNCGNAFDGASAVPRFCPSCGQETQLHPPTFFEFVHEFVGHYVALEGALWRTLALLIFRPGRLTLEYLRGRRRRYVLALRVYLSASFAFFLAVKVLGVGNSAEVIVSTPATASAASDEVSPPPTAKTADLTACAQSAANCGAIERRISSWLLRMERAGVEGQSQVNERVNSGLVPLAPYAMFAMQPVFAALVTAGYRRRQQTYGAHFVFSLHLHAFWFLALLAMTALPSGVDSMGLAVIGAYTVWALRSVYGGRWWATLLRAAVLAFSYGVLLLVMVVLIASALAVR